MTFAMSEAPAPGTQPSQSPRKTEVLTELVEYVAEEIKDGYQL